MSSEKGKTSSVDVETGNYSQGSAPAPPLIVRAPPVDGSILGLFAFAGTCLTMSLYNCRAANITVPNSIVGMALGLGGLGQFIGGLFELIKGSAFTGTVFLVYTSFWVWFAALNIPELGIAAAYADDPAMLGSTLGIALTMYAFVTLLFILIALRTTVVFVLTLVLLEVTLILLAVANYIGSAGVNQGAGVAGVLTALCALYMGTGGLLALQPHAVFLLPQGVLRR